MQVESYKHRKNKKSKKVEKITKSMNLGQLAKAHPEVAQFLQEEYNLGCVGCAANAFDTLEMGMKVHGYSAQDIEQVVKEANSLIGT